MLGIPPGVLGTPPGGLGIPLEVFGTALGVLSSVAGTSSPASPPPWMTKCSTTKVLVKPPASPVLGLFQSQAAFSSNTTSRDKHLVSAWVVEPVRLGTLRVAQEHHRCALVL